MKSRILVYIAVVLALISLSGCDQVKEVVGSFSEKTESGEQEVLGPTVGAQVLDSIVSRQQQVIDDLEFAKNLDDKEHMVSLFRELADLEDQYQQEFERYENELTRKEMVSIGQRHYDTMRRMPKFKQLLR